MKKHILFIISIFVGSLLFAGSSTNGNSSTISTRLVTGKVVDKSSGEVMAGVEIKIDDEVVYTDLNGNFIAEIKTNKTEILVSYVSYTEAKITIDPLVNNTVEIQLEPR